MLWSERTCQMKRSLLLCSATDLAWLLLHPSFPPQQGHYVGRKHGLRVFSAGPGGRHL